MAKLLLIVTLLGCLALCHTNPVPGDSQNNANNKKAENNPKPQPGAAKNDKASANAPAKEAAAKNDKASGNEAKEAAAMDDQAPKDAPANEAASNLESEADDSFKIPDAGSNSRDRFLGSALDLTFVTGGIGGVLGGGRSDVVPVATIDGCVCRDRNGNTVVVASPQLKKELTAGGHFQRGLDKGSDSILSLSHKAGDIVGSATGKGDTRINLDESFVDPLVGAAKTIVGSVGGTVIDAAADTLGIQDALKDPAEVAGLAVGVAGATEALQGVAIHEGVKSAAVILGSEKLLGITGKPSKKVKAESYTSRCACRGHEGGLLFGLPIIGGLTGLTSILGSGKVTVIVESVLDSVGSILDATSEHDKGHATLTKTESYVDNNGQFVFLTKQAQEQKPLISETLVTKTFSADGGQTSEKKEFYSSSTSSQSGTQNGGSLYETFVQQQNRAQENQASKG